MKKYNFINLLSEKKTFNDIYNKKNKWFNIVKGKNIKELSKNLYVLVDGAYKSLGGHVGIKTPNDVISGYYNYWEAIDNNTDPDADAVLFGKKENGIKIGGIGHDRTKTSKHILIEKLAKTLHRNGYWVEASQKLQEILLKTNAPYITDKDVLRKLYPNSEFTHLKDGKYIRTLNDDKKTEIEMTFGRPKI
jgi:hypothetical protein